ncbi:GHKL domain-containing protein [Alkaliphilus crotonatoxidans]
MLYPMGDLKCLFITGMKEIMLFYLHFGFVILAAIISQRLDGKKRFVWVISFAVLRINWVGSTNIKSESMISIMFSLLLTVELYLMKILPFDRYDYVLLFAAFLFPRHLFNSSHTFFGYSLLFLIIFSVLFGFGKIRMKHLKGKMFCYYAAFIYLSLTSFIFQIAGDYTYEIFRQQLNSAPAGLIVMEGSILLILWGTTYFLQKKLEIPLNHLNSIGTRYPKTEKYIIYLSCFTAVVFTFLHVPFALTRTSSRVLQIILSVFSIAILLIQIMFIILLFKVTQYKETLMLMKWESKNTATYYASLDKNLEAMANIRHDIKNVFLTMGNYVEKSDNQGMKNFFWKKIYPFAVVELEKNYLFSQLCQIPSEPLRAFLYLKLSHAYNIKENISLEIKLNENDFNLGIDIIDLTRILGILLDNAIEECINTHNGYIEMIIRSNETMTSYIIKNTITNEKMREGIQKNRSTKEGHSGIGLKIVDMIINEYPSVALNSCVNDDVFIQSLNITHQNNSSKVESCCC